MRRIGRIILLLLVTGCGTACRSGNVAARSDFVSTASKRAVTADVRDFGAVRDGRTDNSAAIEHAIEWATSIGRSRGACVYFPKGDWLTGPITLRSHFTLHLDVGATLRFSTNPDDYPLTLTRWEGTDCYNFRPFIYGSGLRDVAIT